MPTFTFVEPDGTRRAVSARPGESLMVDVRVAGPAVKVAPR